MADQLPYCIHCGAQQLNADARFCHRCGQPIEPVKPGRRQLPPWVGPVLVSTGILLVAAIVFSRLFSGGPAADKSAAATSAPPADAGTVTPATAAQSLGGQVTPPRAEIAPTREMPTPPSTETLQPTPTLVNVTPGPLRLTRLAWSTDGELLAVGSGTGVYLYDAATWQETRFIPLQVSVPSSLGDGPDQLAFSFDGVLLATLDRIVQVWRVADGSLAYELKASGFLGASPAEGLWATFGEEGSTSGNLRLWRTSDGQLVRTIATNLNFPFSLAFSSDGRLIAAGPMEGSAPGVWQVADGRLLARLNWEMADAFGWADLAFQPNTTTVAAVGGLVPEAVLLLWDANSGSVTRQLIALHEMPQGPTLNRVSYAPDGSLLAASLWGSTGQQSKVQLWSADGVRGRSWALPGPPSDIAFSPDGKLLAILTGQSLYLYNPDDGSVVHQVEPVWHQGVLPTPTPTPLHVGLNVPAEWREYVALDQRFRLRFPALWYVSGEDLDDVEFINVISTNPLEWLRVSIETTGCWGDDGDAPGSPALLDAIRKRNESSSWSQITFIAGGKWPYLVPGTYGEFQETITGSATRSHKIELRAKLGARQCVAVTMIDDRNEIREDDRQDLDTILASIEFADPQHPIAPPPVVAPEHVRLPLNLYLSQRFFSRTSSGDCGEWSVEIRDGEGRPVQGAQLRVIGQGDPSAYDSVDGRVTWRICPNADKSPVNVEVYLNGTLTKKASLSIWWK